VVRGLRRRVPDLDLKMVVSSSSAPYPAGAAPWWPSIAGSVVGLRIGGGAQTGRNPWLAMPATTVATPEGAIVLLGGSVEVPSPPFLPLCYPGEIPNPLGLGGSGVRRRLLVEGAALGARGVWVCAISGGKFHRYSQCCGCGVPWILDCTSRLLLVFACTCSVADRCPRLGRVRKCSYPRLERAV
jgi:hypothetical protein